MSLVAQSLDERVRMTTGWAVAWAERQERRHPGRDWWSVAGAALQRAAETYRPGRSSFFYWFNLVLRQAVSQDLRRKRYRDGRLALVERAPEETAAHDDGPARVDARDLFEARVRSALDGLSPEAAEAVLKCVAWGHSQADLARERGCSSQVVGIQIRRSLGQLRASLGVESAATTGGDDDAA